MHIRRTATLVILGFFLASLGAFCQSKESPQQAAKALASLVKMKPGLKVDPRAIQGLVDKILEDNAYLAESFGKKEFFALADRLGERGASLLTHKYEKKWGKDSARFWKDSWKEGASLEVVTVGIMVTDIIGTQAVQECLPDPARIKSVTYNLAATVVQEFHVKEPAPTKGNATSLGGSIYRHQDTCVWE